MKKCSCSGTRGLVTKCERCGLLYGKSASMRCSGLLLLVFLATLSSTRAQCSLDEMVCCVSHFSNVIRPSGITFSEQSMAGACTMREESEECMDLFVDQCMKNETDRNDIEDLVNKTKSFLRVICSPNSVFMSRLKEKEECILNSSMSFQTCYNKTVVSRSSKTSDESLKKDCCEYKALRDCALQTVENQCGPTASDLIHEEVVHVNGAVLEWACTDIFSDCGNSAVALASTALFALYSVAFLLFLL